MVNSYILLVTTNGVIRSDSIVEAATGTNKAKVSQHINPIMYSETGTTLSPSRDY